MRRRVKKRFQVRMSAGGGWGEVVGAVEAGRVDRDVRDVVVVDGRVGCRVRSHGLSAVLKADLGGRERWEARAMDVMGLRRAGWGAMRVAIVCWTPFRRFVLLERWREVVRKIGAGFERARTAQIRACEYTDRVVKGYVSDKTEMRTVFINWW